MKLDSRINEEAVAIERVYFVKTDKRVNPKKVNPFCYLEGNKPFLISAPYAVRYLKKKDIKSSAEFTGSLAYLLNKLIGCHGITVNKFYGEDPDGDVKSLYKEKVADICQEHKIKQVINLKGGLRDSDPDLEIVFSNHETQAKLTSLWDKRCKENNLNNLIMRTNVNEETVSNFVQNELGIMGIDLYINRKYRVPHQNGIAYGKLIQTLTEILCE
jgi:hypothetical protein